MSDLAKKQCIPCQGGIPALTAAEMKPLYEQLEAGWNIVKDHHLEKTFEVKDFAQALDMANRIGTIAEMQGHHPDLYLAWGKLGVTVWTHKIDGLTESDFIFAAKCDVIYRGMMAAQMN